MTQKIKSPALEAATGLDEWIVEDLEKSGLTPENFTIEPLRSEAALKERLGFTRIGDTPIMGVGGYWIIYPDGSCRLKLREKVGDVKYLSPKNGGNHAYILPAVAEIATKYNPDKPLFFTEGEKKAAKATIEGFPCIGLAGVWNWKEEENDFLPQLEGYEWKDRTVYIVFDSDIVGKRDVQRAEIRLAVALMNRNAVVRSIRLPNEPDSGKNGLDDYIKRYGASAFGGLVGNAKPTLELHVDEGTSKRIILKELHGLAGNIDREKVLKLIAKREGVPIDAVRSDYNEQAPKQEEQKKPDTETYTPEEIAEAQKLLLSPGILERMIHATEGGGHVGEEINKKTLFLAFTSRKMDKSISCIIKGASASGKNALVDSVLGLFPKGEVLSYSIMTGKALAHFPRDLSHKILFIKEHAGSEAADYSIRTSLSEGEISIALPVKDETSGKWETQEKRISAKGMVFVETTTRERIHPENQTRLFDLYVDESPEQTKRILMAQARDNNASANIEAQYRTWRAAQTLLESLSVRVPYADKLITAFPTDKVRVRRDFPRFLSLIKTHALLYQFQREKDAGGQIIATVEDLKAILPIAEVVLAQSQKEISPKLEKVLRAVEENFGVNQDFTFGELEKKAEFKARTLRGYLKTLIKAEYLEHNGKTGKDSRYILLSPACLIASMPNFSDKCLKLLENFEANSDLPQSASMPQSETETVENEGDRGNGANRGKNGFASINVNDSDNLRQEKPFEAKRQEEFEEWEREATEFLKKAENAQ